MATNIASGDLIMCMNSEGQEEHGLANGLVGVANSVLSTPDGEYVNTFVESVGKFVVVNADRFVKAYRLFYRIWPETGDYEYLDGEEAPSEEGTYVDITLTVPETMLSSLEEVLKEVFKNFQPPKKEGEVDEAAH